MKKTDKSRTVQSNRGGGNWNPLLPLRVTGNGFFKSGVSYFSEALAASAGMLFSVPN